MSDNTRNFYGRAAGLVEERYMAAVLGTFRMAAEEHLPITVVNDWNLNSTDLARYKVLILPNAACLDDAQVAAVRKFVRSGGGLVASLDTSLFDEFGNPREKFALADIFGVDYRGLPQAPADVNEELDVNFAQAIGPDYWEKRKNVFDFKQDPGSILNQGRMKTYVGDNMVTFKGPAVRVTPHGDQAQTIATMQAKSVTGVPFMPAVVTNRFGQGRVAYFAAGLDAAYYLYAYPYQRLALKHAVEWAAPAPAPVRIDAPMCVHSTVMRQTKRNADGIDRLVVHLFNDLNTTAHHALPADDVPLREETVPIRDIRITFDSRYRFRRVHVEPQGLNLELQPNASGTTIVVPQLDVHAMVIGELVDAIAEDRGK